MSGTKAGAAKGQKTIRDKYGVNAEGKSIMHRKAGLIGGATEPTSPRGFAKNPKLASKAGKIGGKLGKRGKNKKKSSQNA